MSIPSADAPGTLTSIEHSSVTTMPGETATEPRGSGALFVFLLAWLALALAIAKKAGFFRRGSIAGPERISRDESPWVFMLIFFGALFLANLVAGGIARFIPTRAEMTPLFLTAVIETTAVPLIVAGVAISRHDGVRRFGLSIKDLPRGVAIGVLTVFVLFPMVFQVANLTGIVLKWMGRPEPKAHEVLQSLRDSHDSVLITLGIVVAIIIAPVFEEIAFRGVLQILLARLFKWISSWSAEEILEDTQPPGLFEAGDVLSYVPVNAATVEQPTGAGPRWLSVCITAALFAYVHKEPAFMPALFLLALGLGYVYERTGNLWATMTAHALFNSTQILVFMTFAPR